MKAQAPSLARAAAALLVAAALPLSPLIAQETAPPADPPVAETMSPPPDATTSIPPPEATAPAQTTAPVTEDEATAPAPAPAARTVTRRTTTRTVTRAPAAAVAPAPLAVAPAPATTLPPVDAVPLPPPVAQTPPPEVLPETLPAPAPTTVETVDSRDSILPWLLAGLLLVGALAFFVLRSRRRAEVVEDVYEAAPAAAPVVAPVAAATPAVAEAPVVAQAPAGRPEIELEMRPVRAGVAGDDARVEFELTVGNRGPVAAEDVRITTWMLASGSSEAESALIVPRDHADTPAVTIGAGESRTLEASVALPTSEVEGDAVLPVVVADARYRLPDGSEGRTSASFAVGVPDGDELAHFGIDNPSGLHEGVVARPLGEPERV
jgi:hypothetical protein